MGSRTSLLLLFALGLLVASGTALAEPGECVPGRCIVMFKAAVAEKIDAVLESGAPLSKACGDRSLDDLYARYGVTGTNRLFADVDLAIKNRGDLTVRKAYEAFQAKIRAKFPERTVRGPEGLSHIDTFGIFVLEFPPVHPPALVCGELEKTGHFVYAEPDRIRRPTYTVNDPMWSTLWGIQKIGCTTAWDTARGNGVVVAVIDTGIDRNHQDLSSRIWSNPGEIPGNNVDDDSNGYRDDTWGWDFVNNDNNPMDDHYHGTHCSGTVAAAGNNGIGVVGVAFEARLMGLKGLMGSDTGLINCINYAVNNGAHVMSCSWGGYGYSSTFASAIQNAVQGGVIPVFAAGNDNQTGTMHGPSNCAYSFSVAASTPLDGRATFSCYGIKIDVTAPGVSVRSTTPGNQYNYLQGTSMATPHVAGALAVLISDLMARSQNPSVEQMRQILRTKTDDCEAPGWDRREGYGRLNVSNMMGVDSTQVCEAHITSPNASAPVTSTTVNIQGYASGSNFQSYTLEYGPDTPYDSASNWTTIMTSSTAVSNNTLHSWNMSSLADGRYTIRLTVRNTNNAPFRDRIEIVKDTHNDGTRTNAVELFANPLTYAPHASRNLPVGDQDWFRMECVAGTAYEFLTTRLTGDCDTQIALYTATGSSPFAQNDDYPSSGDLESRLAWTCSSSGTYYLRLYEFPGSGPGSCHIQFKGLFKDGAENDGQISSAKSVTPNSHAVHRSIVPAGDMDWFSFVALAGHTYTIEATKADSARNMFLSLFGTNGSTVLRVGTAGADNRVRVGSWTAPSTGTYYLRTSAGTGAAGHYLLRIYEKQDLLYHETFQTVGDDLWTPTGGNWIVSGGEYIDTSNANTPHYSHGGLAGWADAVLDADVRFQNSSTGSANAGLILRYINDNNLVVARIRQDNRIQILQWENGNAEFLATVNKNFSVGTTYPLRVTFEGPNLIFEVGGTVVEAAFSPRFMNGELALRSYGSQGVFDNLRLWRPGAGSLVDFVIDNNPFPDGMQGAAYTRVITASGGATPYTFSLIGGSPPPGITVATNGTVSGTATASGTFIFNVMAVDAGDRLRTRSVSLAILPATTGDTTPPTIAFVSPTHNQEVPGANEILRVDVTDSSAVKAVDARVGTGTWIPMTFTGSDRYELPIVLSEGPNNVEVRAEDYASNTGSSSINVELDTSPPGLTVDSHASGTLVTTDVITLFGTADDATGVTVDGSAASNFNAVTYAWSTDITLIYGFNQITLRATDQYLRQTELVLDLYYRMKGDVDGDGDVDDDDARLTAHFEAGDMQPSAMEAVVADVDENGVIDINDVYAIRRVATGEMTFN